MWDKAEDWHLLHTYCVLGTMQSIFSWNNNNNNNSWHILSFIICYAWNEMIHLRFSFNPHNDGMIGLINLVTLQMTILLVREVS